MSVEAIVDEMAMSEALADQHEPSVVAKGELRRSKVTKLSSIARYCVGSTGGVRPDGGYYVAEEDNSFGLPSVNTCPGKTAYCELDCYAVEAERRTKTAEKLEENLKILKEAGTEEAMAEKLRTMVSGYRDHANKLKIPEDKRRFRIHWSGDFPSVEYAGAWATVIKENPDIKFFVYTRSYGEDVNVLPKLTGIENLDLFLSVDFQNVDRAAVAIKDAPDARVAYLVDYYEQARALAEKMGRAEGFRQMACPENMRKENGERILPVVSEKGGACSRCTYCIDKSDKWDVVFVKTGYNYAQEGMLPLDYIPVEISSRPTSAYKARQAAGLIAASESKPAPSLF